MQCNTSSLRKEQFAFCLMATYNSFFCNHRNIFLSFYCFRCSQSHLWGSHCFNRSFLMEREVLAEIIPEGFWEKAKKKKKRKFANEHKILAMDGSFTRKLKSAFFFPKHFGRKNHEFLERFTRTLKNFLITLKWRCSIIKI